MSPRLRRESVLISLPPVICQVCHDVVEREPYFRLCLSEVCGCAPQKSCHCTVLTAYARHCAQEGVALRWRNHTFCGTYEGHRLSDGGCLGADFYLRPVSSAVQCAGGQVHQECGRACGSSCSDLRQGCGEGQSETDMRMCVPGCQCPPGLVQDHQSQCVPVNMCPCVQEDKTYQPGAVIHNNCNTWYGDVLMVFENNAQIWRCDQTEATVNSAKTTMESFLPLIS